MADATVGAPTRESAETWRAVLDHLTSCGTCLGADAPCPVGRALIQAHRRVTREAGA
ncbi:hypothetical protein [Streptomyces sp. SAJ15]|uniref:hypothetical protein n=1 Tax=Streptomyces sp. SAJ15 TaxID=2011095 RepID=UPI00164340F5|nr:hypothetical protein [Streptomyces sp. SAJ15]